MILTRVPKGWMCNCVRFLASRKHGPFQKVPHMPVKGPRDFDYWKRLKRKGLSKKVEHHKENTYRTNQLRRKKQPPKKKCEEKPIDT